MAAYLGDTTSGTIARFVPSQCALCHAWPAHAVCADCRQRFVQSPLRCQRCALRLPAGAGADTASCGACLRTPPPLHHCVAAVSYAYPWSELLGRYKFSADPGWAKALAALMRTQPQCQQALQRADYLLPVPLTLTRLRERGFNQSLLLARALERRKTQAQWLLRLHDTAAQSTLARTQRLRNMRGAFAVHPLHAAAIRGQRVLLLDDVMTSGATLFAAADVLLAAGAGEVNALVLARTELD